MGTLKARRNEVPRDALTTPSSLDAWFRESGLVDGDTECRPDDLDAGVVLREAIHDLVAARLHAESYDDDALAVLNRMAEVPSVVPQLTASGRRTEAAPDQALSSIARNAIDVLSGPDAELLKECGRPECTQVYLDRSHGARREWCAMKTCGNKMKARAYRARKKSSEPAATTSLSG